MYGKLCLDHDLGNKKTPCINSSFLSTFVSGEPMDSSPSIDVGRLFIRFMWYCYLLSTKVMRHDANYLQLLVFVRLACWELHVRAPSVSQSLFCLLSNKQRVSAFVIVPCILDTFRKLIECRAEEKMFRNDRQLTVMLWRCSAYFVAV